MMESDFHMSIQYFSRMVTKKEDFRGVALQLRGAYRHRSAHIRSHKILTTEVTE
jgi:hypothetical protein